MMRSFLLVLISLTMHAADVSKTYGPTRGRPVELEAAVKDLLTIEHTPEAQQKILRRIDVSLRGGAQLKDTDYSLTDITQQVSRDQLHNFALKNYLWGILTLFGPDRHVGLDK